MAGTADRPWADGPWALIQAPSKSDTTQHAAHYIAHEMLFAHNAMLRGLNAIYLQGRHIPAPETSNFLFFIASWCNWVLHHHDLEETQMFPEFEAVLGRPGALNPNLEQHHAFSPGLTALRDYAANPESVTAYNGAWICALIDRFAAPFRQHLEDEIATLIAMKASEREQELLDIYKKSEKEAQKQDKFVVPPLVLGLCDATFEGGNDWPKMPTGSAYIVH